MERTPAVPIDQLNLSMRKHFDVSLVVCLVSVVSASGCSRDSRVPVHPVHGSVTFQNQPALGAVVVLRPVSPEAMTKGVLPHGAVGSDGRFRMSTYIEGDGAPVGDYIVTINWPETRKDKTGDDISFDRLNGRFHDTEKSPWHIAVREGDNLIGPFKLD
jgi:hypothetical protein